MKSSRRFILAALPFAGIFLSNTLRNCDSLSLLGLFLIAFEVSVSALSVLVFKCRLIKPL